MGDVISPKAPKPFALAQTVEKPAQTVVLFFQEIFGTDHLSLVGALP
ncbi:hypothetical protein [Lacibacter luteus]|nr:hypothetical protein [Lacibacter luteus]